jgi:hypothetical protein
MAIYRQLPGKPGGLSLWKRLLSIQPIHAQAKNTPQLGTMASCATCFQKYEYGTESLSQSHRVILILLLAREASISFTVIFPI